MAWGRTAAEWEQLEGGLFGASLLPYLAFLYFLARTDLPPLAQKGFRFLLVFVFASIPAAIAAKVLYGEVLANVDPIHGAAESLLTVTNLILVLGMRRGVREAAGGGAGDSAGWADWAAAGGLAVASAALLVPGVGAQGSALLGSALGWHVEPANALSVPTWAIHASSLVEWVIAMGLIWQYAEVTGQPRWKGLTIAMIPCHSSGLCAVTWHLLYNAPALAPVVAAQAALTTAGNTTCAFAAWRVASAQQAAPGKAYEVEEGPEGEGGEGGTGRAGTSAPPGQRRRVRPQADGRLGRSGCGREVGLPGRRRAPGRSPEQCSRLFHRRRSHRGQLLQVVHEGHCVPPPEPLNHADSCLDTGGGADGEERGTQSPVAQFSPN